MSISLPAAMPEPTRPRRRACHTSCAPSLSARTFSQSTPKRFILPEKAVRGFDAAIAVEYFFPSRALSMTFKHCLHHLSAPESSPSLTCLLSSQAVVRSKRETPSMARMHQPRKSFHIANSDPSMALVATWSLLNVRRVFPSAQDLPHSISIARSSLRSQCSSMFFSSSFPFNKCQTPPQGSAARIRCALCVARHTPGCAVPCVPPLSSRGYQQFS